MERCAGLWYGAFSASSRKPVLSFTASSKLGKSLRSVQSDLVRLSAALALIPDEEQAWLHRRA